MCIRDRTRGYFKIGDIPVGKQIAPEGHLGGIVGLVLVVQVQLPQAAVGVAVGDDAHHLGVCLLYTSSSGVSGCSGSCGYAG